MSWAQVLCAVAERCDSFNIDPTAIEFVIESSKTTCVPLLHKTHRVGIIRPDILKKLEEFSNVFISVKNSLGCCTGLRISEQLNCPGEVTVALDKIFLKLRHDNVFPCLKGWRDEMYAVGEQFQQGLFNCERAAARLLGVRQYGVHINGYVLSSSRELKMWVGRRSFDKPTYPGMLDNMVAGGISAGVGALETLIKECKEEASIPKELAEKAKPAGSISYIHEASDGIEVETEFIYDLEVPVDFVPCPLDGEVSEYFLWNIEKVKSEMAAEHFKPNCALVILKFMIRRGFINPDTEPLYEKLSSIAHVDLSKVYSNI